MFAADIVPEGREMESDQLFYRRRAIEERLAAQRSITEQAREWHAKLAREFAERASGSGDLAAVA